MYVFFNGATNSMYFLDDICTYKNVVFARPVKDILTLRKVLEGKKSQESFFKEEEAM